MAARMAKKECEYFAEDHQSDSKKPFKEKQPSKEIAVLHDAKGKGALRDNKAIAEKLSDLFVWVFTAEGV